MPMHIHFCNPDIAEHPTGGNRYNAALRTAWPSNDTCTTGTAWPEAPAEADAWLVDSLLLRDDGLLEAWATGPPAVLTAHYLHLADPTQHDTPAAQEEADRLSLFGGYVAPSHFVKEQLSAHSIAPRRVVVGPPGLDHTFRTGRDAAGTALDPPAHLLSVANRFPNKQLIPCLHMLEDLRAVPWQWHVIGDETLDPGHAAAFREAVAASPVSDRVHVQGAASAQEVRAAYARADVVLCPSRFETSGMVAREALAAGVPVLGFRVGGLPETLGTLSDACLVPAGDFAVLRTRLHEVLTTPRLHTQLAWQAVRVSRGTPCWAETAWRIRQFVQQVAV
ncbi:glycosyltransferase family 4 protein [Longimonas halophila]|nr:glycosyltransferase family 4 protein [Longimonas halophila]